MVNKNKGQKRVEWVKWWDDCADDLENLGLSDALSNDVYYVNTPSTLDLSIPISLKDYDFPVTIRRSFHSLNVINDYWIKRPWDTRENRN